MHDPFNKEGMEKIRNTNQKNVLAFEAEKDAVAIEEGLVEDEDDLEKDVFDKMEVFKKDIIQSENPEDDEEQMLGKRLINLPDEKKQKL